jgi:hypothetical protein
MGLICRVNLAELVGLADPPGNGEVLFFKITGQNVGILCDECARDREPPMVLFGALSG